MKKSLQNRLLQVQKTVCNKTTAALVTGGALMASAGAASADVATDITAAFTAAESNVVLAAGGLIGVAAIMTGIGFIISLLRR